MATKDKYEFFRSQYDSEAIKSNDLNRRAEIYLSIVTFFLTSIFFKIKELMELINTVVKMSFFLLSLIFFAAALVMLLNALKIRRYIRAIDIEDYFKKLPEEEESDADFFDDRIVDFSEALINNARINMEKGNNLVVARAFILFGFISAIGLLIIIVIQNLQPFK